MPATATVPTAAFDALVDSVSALVLPDIKDDVLHRLAQDLAQRVHPLPVIAIRYGFDSLVQLHQFMRERPEFVRRVKAYRAIWESDANAEQRVRALNAHVVLEATPETAKIILDPKATAQSKIDAMKLHAQMAGLIGPGSREQGQGGAAPGARFAVNIIFSGGRTESITTVETAEPAQLEGDAA